MPMQYVEGPDDLYHQPFYWSHTPGDKNLTGFGKVRLYNAAEATDCVINFRGNDYFTDTHADRCIVNGSKKVNLIMNFGDNSKVFGNGGNDTLMNSNANHCTIIGGKDNDVIHQKDGSAYVYIDAGDGANTILNWNTSNTTIKSGKNNDFISNFQNASNVVIDSGSGNDNIQIHGGNYFTVNGGKGNDRITNYTGNNVSIKSGSAKDTLYGDIISNGHIRSHYQYMQGSSLLESISEYVKGKGKLEWVAVSDEIAEGGSDVSITAGGGDDEIMNFGGSNVKINTGNGKNLVSLVGSVSQLSIKGGADNDTVYGGSSEVYYEKNSYSGNAQV